MTMRRTRTVAALIATGLMAACTTVWDNEPEAFREGWSDGCDSGIHDFGTKAGTVEYARDERRYKADADYGRGWGTGYDSCYVDAMRKPNLP